MKKITATTIGSIISFVLALSAYLHLSNPYAFLASIYEYHIVSREFAELLAMFMPFVHLTIVICLISSYKPRAAFMLACALFFAYGVIQASAAFRGLEIECGCFKGFADSSTTTPISWKSILFAFSLSLASALGWQFSEKADLSVKNEAIEAGAG